LITEQKIAAAEDADGPVVLDDTEGGLDPWTAAVWLAARNDKVRITLPGAPAAVSEEMADKALDSLAALAGPRVSTGARASRFDDLPASVPALEPGDPGYRGRSSTYMRGGKPALILRPRTPAEVADALAFARRHPELQLGLRSGGHGISGRSTNTGGLIIDVGDIDSIEMLGNGLVRVGPGATWKQVAAYLDKYDLALGSGDYGGVGVGGLATAGGIGFLSREQGLTIDRLRAVELVLADGTLVRASAEENQDLFWAVRGAGANFGVATAFEFEADEVTEVGWAQLALVSQDLVESMRQFGEVARNAPRDTTVFWLTGQPRQGQSVIQMYGMVDSGDPDTIIERLTPFATTGLLAQQQVVVARYADVMAQAADVGAEGHHGRGEPISRSGFLPELTEAFARDAVQLLRSGQTFFFQLRHMGGAIADTPADATAFAHRTPEFSVTAIGMDRQGLDAAWDLFVAKHFDGLYLSFETDQRPERLHDAFPPATLARLRELKRRYDPTELFRDNFAISLETS
jgi:hypothetical protein